MHWREFADVQIKTAKTQKHLYCPAFTKAPIFEVGAFSVCISKNQSTLFAIRKSQFLLLVKMVNYIDFSSYCVIIMFK